MSPRAACRLEALGFAEVYDYVAGKADWLAHNLPVEGKHANAPTAGRAARGDVVTCRLHERVGAVRERLERSPYGFALVTSPGGVLLGRVRASAIRDPQACAADVMEPGPSTVRPQVPAPALAKRLGERDLETAIVTTPEGELIGVARREDLARLGQVDAMQRPTRIAFDLDGTLLDPAALLGRGRERMGPDALDDAVMQAMADTLTGEHRPGISAESLLDAARQLAAL